MRRFNFTKIGRFMFNWVTAASKFVSKHPVLYYILNYTWGLPLTIIGWVVSLVCLLFGKPHRYKYIYYIQTKIDGGWGFETGTMFVVSKDIPEHDVLLGHEFGHTCQNAVLGPFQILLVTIPSVIRYWFRELCKTTNKPYDAIWFEYSASVIGGLSE